MNVTASRPVVAGRSSSSAILRRSAAALSPDVSITRSARSRSGASSSLLGADAVDHAAVRRQRVAPARLLVARRERLLVGLEEEHAVHEAARRELVEDAGQRREVLAAARVGDDRRALDLRALVQEQLDSERIISAGRLSTQK